MAVSFLVLLTFLILQRLGELALSRRNERWLRARGAREVGKNHYPGIIALHLGFFISLLIEVVGFQRVPARWWWLPFGLFLSAQVLRYWTIATLGHRWTTRVLVLSGAALITDGPYRFVRHPNYLAVAIEILSIPLIFQAYVTALVFSVLNVILMAVRIPIEDRALRQSRPVPDS